MPRQRNFDIDPRTTYNIRFTTSPVVPARLEAEAMRWDDNRMVVLSEDPNEVRILEKDSRIALGFVCRRMCVN